jgi:hypothetical protein
MAARQDGTGIALILCRVRLGWFDDMKADAD